MSDYFADAGYWFALIDDDDEFHTAATEYATLLELRKDRIVTTQLVLNEVLNPRGGSTAQQRQAIIALIDRIRQSPQVDRGLSAPLDGPKVSTPTPERPP